MKMTTNRVMFSEFIHWMVLWVLAALVISVLHRPAIGGDKVDVVGFPSGIVESKNVTLDDVLMLNQRRDYKAAITVWQQLDITRESAPWKHIGIGAAYLRLRNLDEAQLQFERAISVNPENAVAEYFLARVCQARIREVPFWYEKDDTSPFRLIVIDSKESIEDVHNRWDHRGAILPHFKRLPYEKQANEHFRRAIGLSRVCELDRTIDIFEPRVRFIGIGSEPHPITVRDLLISLDEEDYVEKARTEIGERFVTDE